VRARMLLGRELGDERRNVASRPCLAGCHASREHGAQAQARGVF